MPVINVTGGQTEFVIDKTFRVNRNRLIALYTNGLAQDITGFEAVYDHESIELPDPIELTVSSFAYDSDEDIAYAIQLAKVGAINLHDYWTVGDTRVASLSAMEATGVGESHVAQNVEFTLMHDISKNGALGGITPASGAIGFIIGQKDSLAEVGYMNPTNTNSGSWQDSKRRTWCNEVYYNALPSYLRDNAVDMTIKTATSYNGTTTTDTVDKCGLFAAKEVFGGTATAAGADSAYSNLTEFNALTQVEYYKTAANRIKKVNGSADAWWERSPRSGYASYFCFVGYLGSAGYYNASYTYGLAPFLCI